MEHSAYKEKLSALLDGELRGAEREAALAHMNGCADCRAYFAELTALRAALGNLEEFDAPGGFAAGVMARIRAGGAAARPRAGDARNADKRRAARRGYAALAACAAVALLAVYALPNAPRMGGGAHIAQEGAAADSASSAVYASPSAAPAAPAPSPSFDYAPAGGGETGGMARESDKAEERGEAAIETPAALENNPVTNGTPDSAAGNGTYVTVVTEDAGEKLSIAGRDEPMSSLSNSEAYGDDLPTLTLSGADAALWLAENGWHGESGAWYADAAALRALPDGLTLSDGGLPEDYDGAVRVELWEDEP